MTYRTTLALILTATLASVPFALAAQSVPESSEATTAAKGVETPPQPVDQLPFDPTLVGLPDFPVPLATFEDYARAQGLIDKEEEALTAAQLAVLERKIAIVQDDVVFDPEALQSRLTEMTNREDAILARIDELTGEGESAESALIQARQHLQEGDPQIGMEVLEERLHAREDELAAARKGVEYRGQVKSLAETARARLKRRYAILQGTQQDRWPSWLRENQEFLNEIGKDRDFTLAELSALHSMELALSRRLAAPDLDAGIREAVKQRVAAIEIQSQLAGEMLLAQDQVRSLAERLRLDLEPRVRERSLDQRLEQAKEQLSEWWGTELAVVQDHGIYVGDAATALGVSLTGVRDRVAPEAAAAPKPTA